MVRRIGLALIAVGSAVLLAATLSWLIFWPELSGGEALRRWAWWYVGGAVCCWAGASAVAVKGKIED